MNEEQIQVKIEWQIKKSLDSFRWVFRQFKDNLKMQEVKQNEHKRV